MSKKNKSIIRQSLVQNDTREEFHITDLIFPRRVDRLIPDMIVPCYPQKRHHVHFYQWGNGVRAHIKNEKTGQRKPFFLNFSQLQNKIMKRKGL